MLLQTGEGELVFSSRNMSLVVFFSPLYFISSFQNGDTTVSTNKALGDLGIDDVDRLILASLLFSFLSQFDYFPSLTPA